MPTPKQHRPDAAASAREQRPAFDYVPFRPGQAELQSRVGPLDEATLRRRASGLSSRVHGVFASLKNNRSIPWSSTGQRDLMTLLEVDCDVLSYVSAPEQVDFVLHGKPYSHVPAFRIATRRGPAILDVRRKDEEGEGAATAKFAPALAEIYAARGLPYRALSRAEIRVKPRFPNAKWVTARCAHRLSREDALLVAGLLSEGRPRSLRELAAALPRVGEPAAVVCAIAVRGSVALDLSAPEPEQMTAELNPGGPFP